MSMAEEEAFKGDYYVLELDYNADLETFIGKATKDWKRYVSFRVSNKKEPGIEWLKDIYKDYDHFIGVNGKFDPYCQFFADPPRCELTFDNLMKIGNRPTILPPPLMA